MGLRNKKNETAPTDCRGCERRNEVEVNEPNRIAGIARQKDVVRSDIAMHEPSVMDSIQRTS